MFLPYGQPHSQRQGNSLGQGEAEFCGMKTNGSLWKDLISTAVNSAAWCWLQQAVKLTLLWEDRGTSSRIADGSVFSSVPLQKYIYIVNSWVQWPQVILWVFLGSPIAYPKWICWELGYDWMSILKLVFLRYPGELWIGHWMVTETINNLPSFLIMIK